jgi:single-strand DNA-binding protein
MPSTNPKRELFSEDKEVKAMTDQQTAQVDPEPQTESAERSSWGPTLNSVQLLGRFAADPEMRYTPGGKAVASARLIVNGRGGPQGFDLQIWERLAETVAQTQHRGSLVLVSGRLVQRQRESPQGDRRSRVEVVATDVQFLSPKQQPLS